MNAIIAIIIKWKNRQENLTVEFKIIAKSLMNNVRVHSRPSAYLTLLVSACDLFCHCRQSTVLG